MRTRASGVRQYARQRDANLFDFQSDTSASITVHVRHVGEFSAVHKPQGGCQCSQKHDKLLHMHGCRRNARFVGPREAEKQYRKDGTKLTNVRRIFECCGGLWC